MSHTGLAWPRLARRDFSFRRPDQGYAAWPFRTKLFCSTQTIRPGLRMVSGTYFSDLPTIDTTAGRITWPHTVTTTTGTCRMDVEYFLTFDSIWCLWRLTVFESGIATCRWAGSNYTGVPVLYSPLSPWVNVAPFTGASGTPNLQITPMLYGDFSPPYDPADNPVS